MLRHWLRAALVAAAAAGAYAQPPGHPAAPTGLVVDIVDIVEPPGGGGVMAQSLFWSANASTFGAGDYSAGDSTPTAVGTPTYGAPAYRAANALQFVFGERVWFDPAGIFEGDVGAIQFAFRLTAWGGQLMVLHDASATNDQIAVMAIGSSGSGNLRLRIEENGVGTVDVDTSGLNLAANVWYFAVARVDESATTGRIEVYDPQGLLLGAAENTSVSVWPIVANLDRLNFGDIGSGSEGALGQIAADSTYAADLRSFMHADAYDAPAPFLRDSDNATQAFGTSQTASITAAAGDLITVTIRDRDGNTPTSVTSSIDGALTQRASAGEGVSEGAMIYELPNASAGTHTITVTYGGNSVFYIVADAWSLPSAVMSAVASAEDSSGAGTAHDTGAISYPGSQLVISAATFSASPGTVTYDTGFEGATGVNSARQFRVATAYNDNPAMTTGNSVSSNGVTVAYSWAPAVLADEFAYTANPLPWPWDNPTAFNDLQANGSAAVPTTSNDENMARYTASQIPYSRITVGAADGGDLGPALINASGEGYMATSYDGTNAYLFRFTAAGSFTQLGSNAAGTWTAADDVELFHDGADVVLRVNGTEVRRETDTTYVGLYPGVFVYDASATIADFSAVPNSIIRLGYEWVTATANSGSSSVDVPPGTTAAVALTSWYDGTVMSMTSLSLGGDALTLEVNAVNSAGAPYLNGQLMGVVYNPPVGSQSFAWDWSGTTVQPDEGGNVLLVFLAGVEADALRDVQYDRADTTAAAVSASATAVVGDYVLKFGYNFDANPQIGDEFIDNFAGNAARYAAGDYIATSTTETASMVSDNYQNVLIATFAQPAAPAGSVSLVVADSLHGHAADTPTLAQAYVLTVADALHGHAADTPTLDISATLEPADSLHSHAADTPTLAQAYALTVADSLHSHSADALSLVQANVLAVADALHAHAADNLSLSEAVALSVSECLHAHAAESPALSQAFALAVADSSHGHAADNVALSLADLLVVADALHAHSADALLLVQSHVLAVADALHAHAADNLSLSEAVALSVSECLHAHAAESPALSLAFLLIVADALHALASETPALTQAGVLAVADALHAHAADVVVLQTAEALSLIGSSATLTDAALSGALSAGIRRATLS